MQFRLQLGTADYIFGQADNSKSHLLTSPSADIKYTSEGWIRELQKYEATYDIDDHLNVNQLYVGAPNAWIEGHPYALTEDPKFNLYVQYRGEMGFESTPIITGMTDTAGQWVDLSSLLDNARGVDKLRFEWTTPVAGQNYSNICFMMTPKAGYYGTVGNRLTVNIAGYCGLGWVETQYDENGAYVVAYVPHIDVHEDLGAEVHMLDGHGRAVRPGDDYDQRAVFNQYMTTKTAEIARPAENTPRVLNESLSFANQTAGKVDVGANQLVVTVENNKAALQSFDGLVSYVILPEGVAYTGNDAQVTASKQGGKTLLTIHWKRDALAPNSVNRLTLPVTVAATLNAAQLAVTIDSTVNQADTVVPRTIDPTDASDVQILANVTDILGTPINQKVYALTLVTPVNDDGRGVQLQSTALAANAAGDEGALVTVRAGEDGQYLLRFAPATSAVLQDVTIHVTLPYVGDQAELSATSRGTTTNDVHLAGPVQLPMSWAGKATVRYITAAAPTGLVAADVTNFADVTGLLVTFNDPAAYLDGGAQTLILPVHVADAATPGTQAYVSAAVSANGLSAAEGLRAGITVGVHQQASATVTYHDDTTDTDLRTVTAADDPTLTGFVGTTSAYDATPVIDEYLQAGYGLASDGTKDANGTRLIAFTTDGVTTNYVVHLYHNFVADKPTTSSQTIHYVDQHQQPLAPDHVDTVSFLTVRDMVTDASQSYVTLSTITGQPVVNDGVPTGEWLVGTTADLAAVANPVITNYRVVATTAANGDLVAVPATTLMANSGAQVVTVSYDFATGEPGTSAAAGLLTIRYVNRYGMQLRAATTQTGYVGNGYSVTAPTLTGYTYVGPAKDSAALTGTFTSDPTTITLVYDLIQGQPGTSEAAGPLTIRYVNRYGMQLRATTTQTGYVGNGYSVTAPTLTGYTYVGPAKDSAALTGTFTSDPTTITLVYDLIQGQPGTSAVSGPLTVRIVDQVGQPLRPALVRTDFVGNGYHVTVPTISGYDYVGLAQGSAALWGTFVATPTTITLVYRQQEQPGTPTPPRRYLPDTGTTSTPTAPTSSPRLMAHTTGTRVTPTPTTRAVVATNRPTTRTLPATGAHRTLPQTGDQTVRSGATLSVLGLGLLSLLSGLWFRKREH
ncbi:MucBP domain-containing protein [Lacticaseibacillus thailandensis]|uniref:MucBP domain-containing protein n=1 Tax=Lacticaseibacillus thailandensis TaxID=381741 RepID=UPI0006D297C7|nr:MucBP domain-containing protein [Lacticaseibacillus thailandensis]